MNRYFALYRLMAKNGYANSYDTTSKFKIFNSIKEFFRKPLANLGFNILGFILGLLVVRFLEIERKDEFISALSGGLIFVNYIYLLLSSSYVFYLFYLNNDLEKYIVLPVKRVPLLFVKYIHFMSYMYFFMFCLFAPLMVSYMMKVEFGIIPILVFLLGFIFIPIALNSLVCVLIFILVRTFKFLRNKNAITYFMYIIVFAIALTFQFNITNKIGSIILSAMNQETPSLLMLFLPFTLLISALNNNDFLRIVLFLLVNFVFFGLYMVCAYYFYYPYATKLSEQGAKKQKVNYEKINKKNVSVVRSLLRREFKSVLRNAHCSFQYVFINFFYVGIFIFIMGFAAYKIMEEGHDLSYILSLTKNFDPVYMINSFGFDGLTEVFKISLVFAAITALIQLATSPNATSFSREGSVGIDSIKTWPIKAFEIFKAKAMLGPLMNVATFSILYIVAFILFSKIRMYIAFAYVFFLAFSFFTGWYALTLNVLFPKFKWENELKVIKQSLSSMISSFTFLILYFAMIFGFTTFGKNFNISQIISIALLFVLVPILLGVVGMFYCYFNSEKILKNFNQ